MDLENKMTEDIQEGRSLEYSGRSKRKRTMTSKGNQSLNETTTTSTRSSSTAKSCSTRSSRNASVEKQKKNEAPEVVEAAEEDEDDGQDGFCAVCCSGNSVDKDLIVFCEKCNVPVHQTCYGIPVIPEGEWHCKRCTEGLEADQVKCFLCGQFGGAMKPTTDGEWVHLLCAWWDPDIMIEDTVNMEPIAFATKVDESRKKLTCQLCHIDNGLCIQCCWKGCSRSFHPMCAQNHGFLKLEIEMGCVGQQAYCDRHKHNRSSALDVITNLCSKAPSGKLAKKLRSIKNRLENRKHYESPQLFLKEVFNALTTAAGNNEAGVSELASEFLDSLSQLQTVYKCEPDEECLEKLLMSISMDIARSNGKIQVVSSPMNCDVCSKPFRRGERSIYCNGLHKKHIQHWKCLCSSAPKAKNRMPTFQKCGSCSSEVDLRAILVFSSKTLTDSESPIRRKGSWQPQGSISPHQKECKLPDIKSVHVQPTKEWIAALPNLDQLDLDNHQEFMNSLENALSLTGSDKYANKCLLRAKHCIEQKKGPAKAILLMLVRDYKRVLFEKEEYDREQEEIAAEKKRKEEEEKRKKEEEEERLKKEAASKLHMERMSSDTAMIPLLIPGRGIKTSTMSNPIAALCLDKPIAPMPVPQFRPVATRLDGQPKRPRQKRCNVCPNCLAPDCLTCVFCKDMKKYGGSGTRKRCCVDRVCNFAV